MNLFKYILKVLEISHGMWYHICEEVIRMTENNIIVKDIADVKRDTLFRGKPYIPTIPRNCSSLAYVTDGQLIYIVGNVAHTVRKGELLFIHGGEIDITEPFECKSVSYILSNFLTLNNDFSFPTRVTVSSPVGIRIEELFAEMMKIWKSEFISKKMKCMVKLYSILSLLFDEIFEKSRDSYRYQKIAAAIEYINTHCLEPGFERGRMLTLSGMSEVNLNRMFKDFFGMTVNAYITEKRMNEAKSLLMNSTNTIGSIASQCGFSDIYSFSHSFRRITGLSPTEWRKG